MLCYRTYTEGLQVDNGEGIAEEVQQRVLEQAAVAVAVES
jgi:hypothetical protein